MGFGHSKEELHALALAKKIREDLYLRINNSKVLYRESFEDIREDKKEKIMISSAAELAELLDENWTTSVEVLFVFIERVCTVGVQCNYVFDEMFEEALEEGRKCDRQRKRDNWKKKCWKPGRRKEDCYPPFFGVPTSIKETILFKGRQTYMGFVSCVNKIPEQHTQFVQIVLKMGLIPFVRSNVAQGCKSFQTHNNIFSYSANPWNRERSCGGSSGGQAGMISSYCAPIGLGSDIGGSLRIPSQFTGITAIKVGHKRFSNKGNCFYGEFQEGMPVKGELGPMSRSVEDLILFTEFFCDKKNYENIPRFILDPYVAHFPLDYELVERKPKMKIGLVKHLNKFETSKPNLRATLEAAQILRKKGNQIIEIKIPNIERYFQYLQNSFTCDQNLTTVREIGFKQPLMPEFSNIRFLNKIPWLLRKIIAWFIRKKYPRIAELIHITQPWDVKKFSQQTYRVMTKLHDETYSIFTHNDLDAILMPTSVAPAPRKGQFYKYMYAAQYVTAWNVLRYPAGTIPISIVQEGQTQYMDRFNDNLTKQIIRNLSGSEGLPVGVQIISTPYNEEKVFCLMEQVEKEVKFRQKFSPKFI